MVKREISDTIHAMSAQHPVITITGPRQSGKTTLAKSLFPEKPYINLENIDERSFASSDPRSFLQRIPQGAVIDEIQRVPELMSYIQTIVDGSHTAGMFILTGSQNFSLMENLTQSLAGRTALFKLMPFNFQEAESYPVSDTADDYLYRGFYPGVYEHQLNPTMAYRNYYETYVERDVRQLVQLKDLHLFQTFIRLCAGRIGQLMNANSLACETGVSVTTIRSWLTVLEASYVIMLLQPYHENIGKRLVKAKKLYFTDVGLAAYLLGIKNPQHVSVHPLRGNLFENLVIMECVKSRYNGGLDHNFFFYRDSNGNEIDVLSQHGHQFRAIEIKSSMTYHPDLLKGLRHIIKVFPDRISGRALIYSGDIEQMVHDCRVMNYKHAAGSIH